MSCNLFAVCFGRSPGRAPGKSEAAQLDARLLPLDKYGDVQPEGRCISKSKLDPERFYAQLAREKSCTSSSSAAQRASASRASEDGDSATRHSVGGEAVPTATLGAAGPRRNSCSSAIIAVALPPRAASDTGAFFHRPAPAFANTTACAVTPSARQPAANGRSSHDGASSSNRPRRSSFAALTGGFRGNQVVPAPAELRAMAGASGRVGGSSETGMHLATTAEDDEVESDNEAGHDQAAAAAEAAHPRCSSCGRSSQPQQHQAAAEGEDLVAPIVHRASGSTSFTSVRCSRPSAAFTARSRRSHSGDDPLAVALGIMRSGSSETSHSRNKRAFEATSAVVTAERRRSTSLARRSRSGGSGGGPAPPGTPPVLTHYPSPPRSRSYSKSRERRASCDAVMRSQTSSQAAELEALLQGQQSLEIPGRCRSFGGGDGKPTMTAAGAAAACAAGSRAQGEVPGEEEAGAEAACSEEVVTQRRQAWLLGSCMKISRSHRRRTRSCDSLDEQEADPAVASMQKQQDQGRPLPGLGSSSASADRSRSNVCAGEAASGEQGHGREAAGLVTPASQSSGPGSQAELLPASEPGCVFGDASTRVDKPIKQQSMSLSADGVCGDGDAEASKAVCPIMLGSEWTPGSVAKPEVDEQQQPAAGSPADAQAAGGISATCSADRAAKAAAATRPLASTTSNGDGDGDSGLADSEDERDAEIASVAASAVAEWRASRAASLASREVSSTGSNLLDSAEDYQCGTAAATSSTTAGADAGAAADDMAVASACCGPLRLQGPAGRQSAHRLSWAGHAANTSGSGKCADSAELRAEDSGPAGPAGPCDGESAAAAATAAASRGAAEAETQQPEAPAQRLHSSRSSRRCSIAGEEVAGVHEPAESGRSLAEATSVRWQQSRSLRPARSILKKQTSHAPREVHVSMCVRGEASHAGTTEEDLAAVMASGEEAGEALHGMEHLHPRHEEQPECEKLQGQVRHVEEQTQGQWQPMPDPDTLPPAHPAMTAAAPSAVAAEQTAEKEGEDDLLMPDTCDNAAALTMYSQPQSQQEAEQLLIGADSEPFGRPPSRRNSRSPGPGDKPSAALKQTSAASSAAVSRSGSSCAHPEQQPARACAAGADAEAACTTGATGDASDGTSYSRRASHGAGSTFSALGPAPQPARGRDSRVSSCCSQAAGLQRCGSGSSSVASAFMTAVTQATRAATAKTSLCETNSHVAMSSGAMSDGHAWATGYGVEEAQEMQEAQEG